MTLDPNNPKPGIYYDTSFADYLATKALNNGYMGDLKECPAMTRQPDKDTKPKGLGRLIHALVLEGEEAVNQRYRLAPALHTRSIKYREWAAETTDMGLEIMTQKDYDSACAVNMAVMMHPTASVLLARGAVETTIIWEDQRTGILCKARPDALPDPSKRTLIDLKSTFNASPESFIRTVLKFGYDRAAVHYMDGMNTVTDHNYDIYTFVVVEPEPPHRVGVYTLDPEFIAHGEQERIELMDLELECRGKNSWPNYTQDFRTGLYITELELPGYVNTKY